MLLVANRTPFGTPWEFSEKEIEKFTRNAYQQAKELLELAQPIAGHRIPTIFVSHTPPHGTNVDRLHNGKHVGSKAIRRFIETQSPDICLTGHIHEGKGTDSIGRTQILNPGMLMKKGWASIIVKKTTFTTHIQ